VIYIFYCFKTNNFIKNFNILVRWAIKIEHLAVIYYSNIGDFVNSTLPLPPEGIGVRDRLINQHRDELEARLKTVEPENPLNSFYEGALEGLNECAAFSTLEEYQNRGEELTILRTKGYHSVFKRIMDGGEAELKEIVNHSSNGETDFNKLSRLIGKSAQIEYMFELMCTYELIKADKLFDYLEAQGVTLHKLN